LYLTHEKKAPRSFAKREIEIISDRGNLWEVRIIFPSLEASDKDMVERLREAKNVIFNEYQVDPKLLELREVLAKTAQPDGIAVDLLIGKINVETGCPTIQFKTMTDDLGNVYENMIAGISLYCLDENGNTHAEDSIKVCIEEKGIDAERIDWKAVNVAVQRCTADGKPVKDLVIAEGTLPDIGTDAELECSFTTDRKDAAGLVGFNRGRKVKKRDVICQKIPARPGENAGWNVLGQELPAVKGLDFELVAIEGAEVSRSGNLMAATCGGIAFMTKTEGFIKTPSGNRAFPKRVEVAVKPVIQLHASDIDDDFVVEASVEVEGNLQAGRAITTRGEIFVAGNVQSGVTLRAGSDISIVGNVDGGDITSDGSVFAEGSVKATTITAANDVRLNGIADSCEISGGKVQVKTACGSKIIAGHKVQLQEISDTDPARKTTIKVGRKGLYEQKSNAARKTIQGLVPSLMKIKQIFGRDKVVGLRPSTIQQILMQHLKQMRLNQEKLEEDSVNHLRRLLEAIDPLNVILSEKRKEITYLQEKSREEGSRKPIIVIRNRVERAVEVEINDRPYEQDSSVNGVAITLSVDGKIKSYELRPTRKTGEEGEKSDAEIHEVELED
jgi:uncharacterized protein (DUF342 family)